MNIRDRIFAGKNPDQEVYEKKYSCQAKGVVNCKINTSFTGRVHRLKLVCGISSENINASEYTICMHMQFFFHDKYDGFPKDGSGRSS